MVGCCVCCEQKALGKWHIETLPSDSPPSPSEHALYDRSKAPIDTRGDLSYPGDTVAVSLSIEHSTLHSISTLPSTVSTLLACSDVLARLLYSEAVLEYQHLGWRETAPTMYCRVHVLSGPQKNLHAQ